MKKKALALAVAGAFFAPASYAVQDNQGMHYTSAAEGFYASIRAAFSTEGTTGGGAGIGDSASRFGVRGTNDLGGGLQGFYQYEAEAPLDDHVGLHTRLAHVGLEGAFGRVWVGSGWTETHNMVYSSTDIANVGGGNFTGYVNRETGNFRTPAGDFTNNHMRVAVANNMIQYRTPDISGFQGALGIVVDAGMDNGRAGGAQPDDNNVDMWSAAGMYSVQGFTAAFAYSVRPDMPKTDANGDPDGTTDGTAWGARLGYAQDNWHINGWYGRENSTDRDARAAMVAEDARYASVAAGVSVGAVNMYGIFEAGHNGNDNAEATTVIGVQYNLGSRSRVWMDYAGKNFDVQGDTEDSISIGLRHDF